MLIAKTALGRWVGRDEWRLQEEDYALSMLHGMRLLGGARATVSVADLANAIDLSPADALDVFRRLAVKGFATLGHGKATFKITPVGFRFAEECLKRMRD